MTFLMTVRQMIASRLYQYICLMRLNKPVGFFLLLWPTLWALWLASSGKPNGQLVTIFVLGVILMRSAGCIINDFADRHFDGYVWRTKERPLASGKITSIEAIILFCLLCLLAFLLVLKLNLLTIFCAFIGAILTIIYPFLKRVTYLPQVGLGIAFAWGVPMAFAAQNGKIIWPAWFLYFTGMLWPLIYDTVYSMVDREDDIKIGVKSMAILLGHADRMIIAVLQIIFLLALIGIGKIFHLQRVYYYSLMMAALFLGYQQILIAHRHPQQCLKAFLNNQWVGMIIFLGILLSF